MTVGLGLMVIDCVMVSTHAPSVTVSVTLYVPAEDHDIPVGLAPVAVAGVPPVKLHA